MSAASNPPFSTCDFCDVHKADMSGAFRVLPPVFQRYGGKPVFAGPVTTVKCHEDNSPVKAAVESPGEGRVLVDGMDITQKGVKLLDVRKKVGLVFQYPEYQLFEETVAKDVAFGPKNMGLSKAEIEERVHWALAQVELDRDKVGNCSPFELSGGQMRRVAIAGVLAMRPKTLILDEPTAGLDPRGRRAILAMIRRLHAETGMTVIMVSHSMDDIASLATRLLVMSRGELVMSGTPREVFRRRDELKAVGLGVPQGAELCWRLRQAGYALPDDLYTLPEVRDAVLTLAGIVPPAADIAGEEAAPDA